MTFQFSKSLIFCLSLGIFFTFNSPSHAQKNLTDTEITAYFSYYTLGSKVRYQYNDWNTILASTVMRVGPSNRFRGKRAAPRTSTRIKLTNPKPSWLEGNRVLFDKLSERQLDTIDFYRLDLEATPIITPLATLSKDEQLAYWLNLYNVTVYGKMAHSYPIVNTKRIWKKGFWDEKLLNVEGIKLSLHDIQNIVISNWESPLVIYGLYQGSIGGPNIQNSAYTEQNVWKKLNNSAKDFINSIRGVQKSRKTLRVSEFYKRTKDAFPNFDEDLRAHINMFADGKTKDIITATTKLKASYYDWSITDVHNGRPKSGKSNSISIEGTNEGVVYGYADPLHSRQGGSGGDAGGQRGISVAFLPSIHSASFLHNIKMKFKTPDFKNNFLFNSNDAKIYVDEVFPVLGKPKEEK